MSYISSSESITSPRAYRPPTYKKAVTSKLDQNVNTIGKSASSVKPTNQAIAPKPATASDPSVLYWQARPFFKNTQAQATPKADTLQSQEKVSSENPLLASYYSEFALEKEEAVISSKIAQTTEKISTLEVKEKTLNKETTPQPAQNTFTPVSQNGKPSKNYRQVEKELPQKTAAANGVAKKAAPKNRVVKAVKADKETILKIRF
jgi:hypothetical protein